MLVAERFTYTSAPQRREKIVQFVTDQGYCTITELSSLFAVSEMTIRRDVSRLRPPRVGMGSLLKLMPVRGGRSVGGGRWA